MSEAESAVTYFLNMVAAGMVATAIPMFFDERNRRRAWILVGGTVVVFILGQLWPTLEPLVGDRLSNSAAAVASDFRVWVLVIVVFWAALVAQALLTIKRDGELRDVIEKDMVPFRAALERWVLPRRLTFEQSKAISDHLANHHPFAVHMFVNEGDEEASMYRVDLQRALLRGGWTVVNVETKSDLQRGLGIHHQMSVASQEAANANDPRAPAPVTILTEALRLGKVAVDQNGTGGGGKETQDEIQISVGERRRDHSAPRQIWPFTRGAQTNYPND